MKLFTLGALLGAAAIFLFDPQSGEERRRRLGELWKENRDLPGSALSAAAAAAQQARPALGRAAERVPRSTPSRRRPTADLCSGIVVGTAAGAALVYLLDPAHGRQRRDRIVGTVSGWRRTLSARGEGVVEELGTRASRAVRDIQKRIDRS